MCLYVYLLSVYLLIDWLIDLVSYFSFIINLFIYLFI